MDTMTAYTTLKACFGPEWEPGIIRESSGCLYLRRPGPEHADPIWGDRGTEYGGDPGTWADTMLRAVLLSAALVACGQRGLDVFVPADEPYRVGAGEFVERFFLGYGPDILSRLCAALAKMKEAR